MLVLYGVAGGSTEGGVALAAGRTQEASSQACDDLYGEMFKYGMYRAQASNDARDAFRRLCTGIDALNVKARGRVKACNELEGARKPFTNIRAGDAPENVVPLSERFLLPMTDSLLAKNKQDDWLGR